MAPRKRAGVVVAEQRREVPTIRDDVLLRDDELELAATGHPESRLIQAVQLSLWEKDTGLRERLGQLEECYSAQLISTEEYSQGRHDLLQSFSTSPVTCDFGPRTSSSRGHLAEGERMQVHRGAPATSVRVAESRAAPVVPRAPPSRGGRAQRGRKASAGGGRVVPDAPTVPASSRAPAFRGGDGRARAASRRDGIIKGAPSRGSEKYYNALRIPRTATQEEVRTAYRHRCLETHPDKTGGDSEPFLCVNRAFTVLSEAFERAEYDRKLAASGSRDGLYASKPRVVPWQKRLVADADFDMSMMQDARKLHMTLLGGTHDMQNDVVRKSDTTMLKTMLAWMTPKRERLMPVSKMHQVHIPNIHLSKANATYIINITFGFYYLVSNPTQDLCLAADRRAALLAIKEIWTTKKRPVLTMEDIMHGILVEPTMHLRLMFRKQVRKQKILSPYMDDLAKAIEVHDRISRAKPHEISTVLEQCRAEVKANVGVFKRRVLHIRDVVAQELRRRSGSSTKDRSRGPLLDDDGPSAAARLLPLPPPPRMVTRSQSGAAARRIAGALPAPAAAPTTAQQRRTKTAPETQASEPPAKRRRTSTSSARGAPGSPRLPPRSLRGAAGPDAQDPQPIEDAQPENQEPTTQSMVPHVTQSRTRPATRLSTRMQAQASSPKSEAAPAAPPAHAAAQPATQPASVSVGPLSGTRSRTSSASATPPPVALPRRHTTSSVFRSSPLPL